LWVGIAQVGSQTIYGDPFGRAASRTSSGGARTIGIAGGDGKVLEDGDELRALPSQVAHHRAKTREDMRR
jgi:hypothetical protein